MRCIVAVGDREARDLIKRALTSEEFSLTFIEPDDLGKTAPDLSLHPLVFIDGREERAAETCRTVAELPGGEGAIILALISPDGPRDPAPLLSAGVSLVDLRAGEEALALRVKAIKHLVSRQSRAGRSGEATRTERSLAQEVLDVAGVIILAIDPSGKVILINKKGCAVLGYREDEIVGQCWFELAIPERLRGAILEEFAEVVAAAPSPGPVGDAYCENPIVTRSGEERRIAWHNTRILDRDGKTVATLSSGEDITEREEMRARLAVADRMASLGTLAAGVAHEINNPLAYILASLDFAARQVKAMAAPGRAGTPATAEELDVLEKAILQAREGSERVRAIAKGLRTFSRGDEDVRRPLDVTAVLESSIGMVLNEIRHRARLVRQYADVPKVTANEGRLAQVFVNLLANAAQAIPEGDVAANEIRVSAQMGPDGGALVAIQDTGAGIAPENLERIFEPFFTTKQSSAGTGLGLSICHGIITALGGKITVKSRIGEGSTFTVALPSGSASAPADGKDEGPPEPAPAKRRVKLLLIDDEPAIRMSLGHLIGLEHDVSTAASARDALDRISAGERFDLLLCDLMMPEMTGIDLYEALRRAAPNQADRMVFLTGGAFTQRAQAFLERVPNAHLEKPFKLDALREIIEAIVR
jgi:PAS domain S-box-containing protein